MSNHRSPRALFVTISFPPLAESQTIRNVYLIRGLLRAGWDVHVVTPRPTGGDPTLFEYLGGNVTVHRTRAPMFDRVMGFFSRPSLPMGRYLRSAFALAWGKVAVPDIRGGWHREAREKIVACLERDPCDILISSAGSNAAHRAVGAVAQSHGRPWLAEYGDPWALNPLPPASLPRIRRRNETIERDILRYCGGMTVTTEETKVLYQQWLGTACPSIGVVPCGYDQELIERYARARTGERSEHQAVTFAYVGSAGRGNRDLRTIMTVLDEVGAKGSRRIALRVIGSASPVFAQFSAGLKHVEITYTGWVSYADSIRETCDASVLILYGNKSEVQIPGKVYPYLASGRPIIYVRQIALERDPTWSIIKHFPGVVALGAGETWLDVIASQLDRYHSWTIEAELRLVQPNLASYEWTQLGKDFEAIARRTANLVNRKL